MKFKLYTLVDITKTGARRGEDPYRYKQQQNYMTLLQTISLRSNPIVNDVVFETRPISNLGFGSKHKGKHKVWSMTFEFESPQSHSLFFLKRDLNLVPVLTGIDETAKFPTKVFVTSDSDYINTIFLQDDK